MTTRTLSRTLALACLLGIVACGGGGGSTPTVQYVLTVTPPSNGTITLNPSGGTYGAGTVVTVTATPAGGYAFSAWTGSLTGSTNPTTVTMDADKVIGATFSVLVVTECDKTANVNKKAALIAAQPVLAVKPSSGKTVKTFTTTFASVAGNALVQCPVDLRFKDLNNDSALQPYEDWTQAAEVRAVDLAGRMTPDQKMALQLHPSLADVPSAANPNVLASTRTLINNGVRFGLTSANSAFLQPRATWANAVQEACEGSSLGIPFVISSEPAHSTGNGRVKARDFSQWPNELSLAAGNSLAGITDFGRVVSLEFRAIGVRMLMGPSANLATEPRWFLSQFTFGEDSAAVANRVEAFVKAAQGNVLGPTSIACVVNAFPGAGPAAGGWDARLGKGKLVGYPGNAIDAHLAPFARAVTAGVAGVMPAYGIPATGAWTGLGGVLDGATIEQVGASFNSKLLTDALRGSYAFGGLVLAPRGVLDNEVIPPAVGGFGAPWGVEGLSQAQRLAKAVNAGVDQFAGLADATPVAAARTAGDITDAQIDASARRALALAFRLGLFENPYVDAAKANDAVNQGGGYLNGLAAMNQGMVLLVNVAKPAGWLDGSGDGTQPGDPYNAGNGTRKVLPAPLGVPYGAPVPASDVYVSGDFDKDYVLSVATGYSTNITNDVAQLKGVTISTTDAALAKRQRMALSDYIFIRIAAPFSPDQDSGVFNYSKESLEYATNDNSAALQLVAEARAAIDGWTGTPVSQAQIIVGVDAGRASVVSEIMAFAPSGLYVQWNGNTPPNIVDKVFLDVAFGHDSSQGTLPVGLPLSNAAASTQASDLPGDGQHPTFVKGFGFPTTAFGAP